MYIRYHSVYNIGGGGGEDFSNHLSQRTTRRHQRETFRVRDYLHIFPQSLFPRDKSSLPLDSVISVGATFLFLSCIVPSAYLSFLSSERAGGPLKLPCLAMRDTVPQ